MVKTSKKSRSIYKFIKTQFVYGSREARFLRIESVGFGVSKFLKLTNGFVAGKQFNRQFELNATLKQLKNSLRIRL